MVAQHLAQEPIQPQHVVSTSQTHWTSQDKFLTTGQFGCVLQMHKDVSLADYIRFVGGAYSACIWGPFVIDTLTNAFRNYAHVNVNIKAEPLPRD